jgi:putative thioredoxin
MQGEVMMKWMSEASTATFQQQVLDRSVSLPVLCDFWGPSCQPCRMLAPLLEAAVEARQGEVWLAKVNVEQEPALAVRYRVQGIPAVKAFRSGRVVDEFVGLRDRHFVDAFLDRLLPSAEERALQQAELLLRRGEPERVEEALRPALASARHCDEARLLLARSQVARGALAEAALTLQEIPSESLVASSAAQLSARVELLSAANGADLVARRREVEAEPESSDRRWQLAASLLAGGKPGEALEQLLELLQRDRSYRSDGARRAMLGIIDELGADHELAREYRRRMQIYL